MRNLRLASCGVVVALGVWGVSAYRGSVADEPPFVVTPTERTLGNVVLGSELLVFEVMNPASTPRRIVGLTEA